jgi:hypothetical protein
LHEEFTRHESVANSSERSFGLTVGAVCCGIGALRLYYGQSYAFWVMGLGIVLAVLALLRPSVLVPLNRLWMQLGLLLSRIINPVIMTLLYCVTIVPVGVAMKLRGKDLLRLKYDPSAASYWILREPPGPAPDSMRNQF